MRISVDTDHKLFFRQLLELLAGIPPLDKLRKRELDLLGMYMYYNYIYKNLDESVRWRIINDTSTRKEMQFNLDMKEDIFNNNISVIRKTKLIDKDGRLATFLQIYPEDNFKLEFDFNIVSDGGSLR